MSEPHPKRLWHYCCGDHSAAAIIRSRELRPTQGGYQPWTASRTGFHIDMLPVLWLTDLDITSRAEAELLGLGRNTGVHTCDRVEVRFRVPTFAGLWWPAWADAGMEAGTITEWFRAALEEGHAPEHWWVSTKVIRGPSLDERYRPPAREVR